MKIARKVTSYYLVDSFGRAKLHEVKSDKEAIDYILTSLKQLTEEQSKGFNLDYKIYRIDKETVESVADTETIWSK